MTVLRSPNERFDDLFIPEPNSGCWLWTGYLDKDGYASISIRDEGKSSYSPRRAHRFSYERHIGPIQNGLDLDHLCRMRCCVNPDHLEPVTNLENHRRGHWAMQTHCKHSHPFSGENLIVLPSGERRCRACQADRMQRWYEKKRKNAA